MSWNLSIPMVVPYPLPCVAPQIPMAAYDICKYDPNAFDICKQLLGEPWKSYATDLHEAPQAEGIYAIGFLQPSGNIPCIYMGHTTNIQGRLKEHKSPQKLAPIDVYVKQQFHQYPDPLKPPLKVKWVKEKNGQCAKEKYHFYFPNLLGYCPHGGPAYGILNYST